MLGPKREEVTGGWRTLHSEELHILYCSPNSIMMIKSMRRVVRMGEMRNIYKILVVNPEGKRSFGRPRRRWEDNIRIDIKAIEWEGVD